VVDGVRLAVSLLTVVPVRTGAVNRATAGLAMVWAPAVGLVVGGVAAAVLEVSDLVGFGPLLGAALGVASMALVTRGLHLDGLADVADGLGSGRPADQALAVMKKSDIGPFGVVTLVLTLLIQVAALARIQDHGDGPPAVVIAAVTGRAALTLACRTGVPPARPEGLGALVAGSVRPRTAVITLAAVLAAAGAAGALANGPRGCIVALAAVLAARVAAAAFLRHTIRRFGGITGDVLGSLVELSTMTALVVLTLLHPAS
jgi:adenosylcobinamide-GDP ribazoletransferase